MILYGQGPSGQFIPVSVNASGEIIIAGGGGGDASAANQVLGLTALDSIYDALALVGTEATSADILAAVNSLAGGATLGDLAMALAPLATEATQADVLAALETQGIDIAAVKAGVDLLVPDLDAVRVAVESTNTKTPTLVTGRVPVDGSGVTQPVSGSVSITGSAAVIGPLTDTQLRASAVPVSAASLPLPAGAALSSFQGHANPCFTAALTGQINGKIAYPLNMFGRRTSFPSVTMCDLVELMAASAVGVDMAGTEALEIVSSSVNDTAAGTGARTVKFTYIDAISAPTPGVQATGTVTLNGTTPVSLGAVRALAIQWAEVDSVGSGSVAAGDIIIRSVATPGNVHEQITAAGNRSRSGRYMVPLGYSAYMIDFDAGMSNQDGLVQVRATVDSTTRALSTVRHFQDAALVPIDTTASGHSLAFLKVPALAKINLVVTPAATTGSPVAQASLTLVVVEN